MCSMVATVWNLNGGVKAQWIDWGQINSFNFENDPILFESNSISCCLVHIGKYINNKDTDFMNKIDKWV